MLQPLEPLKPLVPLETTRGGEAAASQPADSGGSVAWRRDTMQPMLTPGENTPPQAAPRPMWEFELATPSTLRLAAGNDGRYDTPHPPS